MRTLQTILLSLVVVAAAHSQVFPQTPPAQVTTPHNLQADGQTPSTGNTGLVMYGAFDNTCSNQGSTTCARVGAWLNDHYDFLFGGSNNSPRSNHPLKTVWTGYVDLTYFDNHTWGIGNTSEAYRSRDGVEADGESFEAVHLHVYKDYYVCCDSSGNPVAYTDIEREFDSMEDQSAGTKMNGVWLFDGTNWSDQTNNLHNGSPVTINNQVYFGYMYPFDEINFTLSQNAVGATVTAAYLNTSGTWTTLTSGTNHYADTTTNLGGNGKLSWYVPGDWARDNTLVGTEHLHSKYWIRVTVAGATTSPTMTAAKSGSWRAASGETQTDADGTTTYTPTVKGYDPTDANVINKSCSARPCPLEYNPTPAATATAKFPYMSRVPKDYFRTFLNPEAVDSRGKHVLAFYLDGLTAALKTPGQNGVQYDDFNGIGLGLPVSHPTNWRSLSDLPTVDATADVYATMYESVALLHARYGGGYGGRTGFQVGTNGNGHTMKPAANDVDWEFCEAGWCNMQPTRSWFAPAAYSNNPGNPMYDEVLPANNPHGTQMIMTCYDYPMMNSGPGTNPDYTTSHSIGIDRAPLMCLAMHYLGWNQNTYLQYKTTSVNNAYTITDEVSAYSPGTTTLAADITAGTINAKLTNAAAMGCPADTFGHYYLFFDFGTGTQEGAYGNLSGNSFTIATAAAQPPFAQNHTAGGTVACIGTFHQSQYDHQVTDSEVTGWQSFFPALRTDIGIPDTSGFNSGARRVNESGNTPWKNALDTLASGSTVTSLSSATCAAAGSNGSGICSPIWRRDFTHAVVLMRPWLGPKPGGKFPEAEIDAASNPITVAELGLSGSLGGKTTLYPLKADGTTGTGVTSFTLAANEAAILMDRPIYPPLKQVTFSPASPYFGGSTTVTLGETTSGATVKYCTDTVNTCNPATGTTGTSVAFGTSSMYIRAQATKAGYADSQVTSWQGAPGGGLTLMTGQTLGTVSSIPSTQCFGTKFTANASFSLGQLGTWVISGNTKTHTVLIADSTGTTLGSVTINESGQPAGYEFASLSSPVSISSGQSYYLVEMEPTGKDHFYNATDTTETSIPQISVIQGVYAAIASPTSCSGYGLFGAGSGSFGPVNGKIQ